MIKLKSEDDIFVIGQYANTPKKEDILTNLINKLKIFNIPILLTGHYPINSNIQKMVDFYLFDKENPALYKHEFQKYDLICSNFWTETPDWVTEISADSFDYCIWSTFRNASNFAKYLNKKNIHYFDYDSNPDIDQYINEFIIPMKQYDAVVFDIPAVPNQYVPYFFSMKIDVALQMFNGIKTQEEYYRNNHDHFYMEDTFYRYLNEMTSNIYITKYKSIGDDIGLCGRTDDDTLSSFLLCDEGRNLYVNFRTNDNSNNFATVINYDGIKTEHILNKGYHISRGSVLAGYHTEYIIEIGKYIKGSSIKIYYKGREILNKTFDLDYETFRSFNKIRIKNKLQ
jgi:hypothetical protein